MSHLIKHFYKKKRTINITKNFFFHFSFFFFVLVVILSINQKNSDLKCCPNTEFFGIELKIDISIAEMPMSFCYFANLF